MLRVCNMLRACIVCIVCIVLNMRTLVNVVNVVNEFLGWPEPPVWTAGRVSWPSVMARVRAGAGVGARAPWSYSQKREGVGGYYLERG